MIGNAAHVRPDPVGSGGKGQTATAEAAVAHRGADPFFEPLFACREHLADQVSSLVCDEQSISLKMATLAARGREGLATSSRQRTNVQAEPRSKEHTRRKRKSAMGGD